MISIRLMLIGLLIAVVHVHASEIAHIDAAEQKRLTGQLIDAIRGKGSLEEINNLIAGGADIKNIIFYERGTICHEALKYKRGDAAEALLKNGADVNVKDANKAGLLHYACFYGASLHTVEFLVRCGANLREKDYRNRTPKDIAQDKGHHNIVKLIEDYESIPDVKEPGCD